MAVTLRLPSLRLLMPELTRAARFPSPHVEVLAREMVLDLLPQPVERQRPHRRSQLKGCRYKLRSSSERGLKVADPLHQIVQNQMLVARVTLYRPTFNASVSNPT